MHIPDGFLDPKGAGGLFAAAVAALVFAAKAVFYNITEPVLQPAMAVAGKVKNIVQKGGRALSGAGSDYLSRIAVVSSFIFAAQMFNFPVAQGTSGHFIGAVFAAVFLGPWGGLLSISLVLSIQAAFFGDGGVAALGANIFNMGIIGAVGGYYCRKLLGRFGMKVLIATMLSAWISVVAASAVCAIEIGFSGMFSVTDTLIAMTKVHSLIGIGEAAITLLLCVLFTRFMKWELQ